MEKIVFEAKVRTQGVKNASKKAFRDNQIIGVVYNHQENIPIVFDRHDFEKLVSKIRSNTMLTLNLDGKTKTVFIKDYSFFLTNHRIQHVDFQELVPGRKVKLNVPIEYTGRPVGVGKGGFVQTFYKSIRIECEAKHLPDTIKIDITNLDVNERIYLKDAPVLDGVRYLQSPDLPLITVILSSRKKSEGNTATAAASGTAKEAAVAEKK